MADRRIYDDEGHARFVTFSCCHRRRLLDHPRSRQIVVSFLADELTNTEGVCCGFVVMPDHVHAILWFAEEEQLSLFMQSWKSRASRQLKKFVRGQMPAYAKSLGINQP